MFWNFISEHNPREIAQLKEAFPDLHVCSFAEDDFTGVKWKKHFGTKGRKRLTKTRRYLKWKDNANALTFRLLMEHLVPEMPCEVVDIVIQFANNLDLGRLSFKKGDVISYGLKQDFRTGKVIGVRQHMFREICVLFDDDSKREKKWLRETDHELQHRIFQPTFKLGNIVRWVNDAYNMEWVGTVGASSFDVTKHAWTHTIYDFYQARIETELEGIQSCMRADFDAYNFQEYDCRVVGALTRFRRRMKDYTYWSLKVSRRFENRWIIATDYSNNFINLDCDLSNVPKNSLAFVHHKEQESTGLQKVDILPHPGWDWNSWFVKGFRLTHRIKKSENNLVSNAV